MAEAVPEWLIVTCASEHDLAEKLGLEDHAACACAVQNFMLSLAGEGIGSKWMTGALGAAPEDVMAAVGAGAGEKLIGAIWYGYPAKDLAEDAKAPPRKKGLDGVLTACP
jgi:nitroreductase